MDIISTINSRVNNEIKYRVVFDVDDVMCCGPILLNDSEDKIKDIRKRIEQYSGAASIDWKHKNSIYLHFFYPNFDKLILSILSWNNWSVDFFSSGVKERNEEVLPIFLKQIISRYSNNTNADYQNIINSGRCRIFSRDHMVKGKKDVSGYETFGQHKKDLTVISDDIENTILIDDDRTYVVGNQYPFICTSFASSSSFRNSLDHGEQEDLPSLLFNPLKSAAYIMGILLSCKEKMNINITDSLRRALDIVLWHQGNTLADQDREYSPWFLRPGTELGELRAYQAPANIEFFNIMQKWIETGEKYWIDKFTTI